MITAVQKANAGEDAGPIPTAVARQFVKAPFDPWMGTGVLLDGQGDYHGFFHAGSNAGYTSRFGAGVSTGRGWIIMTNGQKDRLYPIVGAIFKEFGSVTEPSLAPRRGP
jgi:hypothetical protein